MSEVLDGISAKIKRAEQVSNFLNNEIQVFCEAQRDLIAHERHVEDGQQIWVFRDETPYPSIDWSIHFGEIVYHLRSGLDHLVWQLVLANGKTPTSSNAFPVCLSQVNFQNQVNTLLQGVSPKVVTAIEDLQPYNGFNAIGGPLQPLWRLHRLCNIDKHRHLNMMLTGVGKASSIGSGDPRFQRLLRAGKIFGSTAPLEKDAILLTIQDLEVEVRADFTIEVKFSQIEPDVTNLPVSNTIDGCHYVATYAIEQLSIYL